MTEDLEQVKHAIIWGGAQHHPTGHDRLYDAARAAIDLFPRPRDPARRRAIVAVTDDVEHSLKVGMNTLITDLLEGDVTLNEIITVLGVTGRRVGFGGVWVGAAPQFLFIPDKDGDDRADGSPQVLLDGWGY